MFKREKPEIETLTITREISQRERSLALHLETRAVHQANQVDDEFRFARLQLFAVVAVDGNVGQGRRAIVLHVRIGRGEEGDEDGDRARVDELLTVFI